MSVAGFFAEYDAGTCDVLQSIDLFDPEDFIRGPLTTDHDKFCLQLHLSACALSSASFLEIASFKFSCSFPSDLSTRCPKYGVAVSGICESFFHQLVGNCNFGRASSSIRSAPDMGGLLADVEALVSRSLFGLNVVEDNVPFCMHEFALQPSGLMQHMAYLDRPVRADGCAIHTFTGNA